MSKIKTPVTWSHTLCSLMDRQNQQVLNSDIISEINRIPALEADLAAKDEEIKYLTNELEKSQMF